MFQSTETLISIKEQARHYYLTQARFSLKRQDWAEVNNNLRAAERMQQDIEMLEAKEAK